MWTTTILATSIGVIKLLLQQLNKHLGMNSDLQFYLEFLFLKRKMVAKRWVLSSRLHEQYLMPGGMIYLLLSICDIESFWWRNNCLNVTLLKIWPLNDSWPPMMPLWHLTHLVVILNKLRGVMNDHCFIHFWILFVSSYWFYFPCCHFVLCHVICIFVTFRYLTT